MLETLTHRVHSRAVVGVVVIVALSLGGGGLQSLPHVYALNNSTNESKFLPVPTCTYDPVIVYTMPPLTHAIPCGDNPATPCLPPQNRTSEGALGIGVNRTIPPTPTCSIPPLNGSLPCNNENRSISLAQNQSSLANNVTNGMIPIPQMCPPGSNESMQGCGKQVYSLDNFTGPHYQMPCKDSPSTMCYYPAPSTQQQQPQPQRNSTTIFGFGLPSFAKTHNNITTNEPIRSGACLDDPAVACSP
jgi:hypothetical protein